MRRFVLAGALVVAACGRGKQLDIPPAEISTEEVEPPSHPLTPSYVSSPIVFDLRPVLQELEEAVPHRMGSLEKSKRIKVVGTPSVSVAPELMRGPFTFAFADNGLTVATTIRYRAKAWASIFSVSCGTGDTLPRMRVKLAMHYDLTHDWHLSTKSRVLELEPVSEGERDQCEISGLKVNVTPKIAHAAHGAVDGALQKLDAKLAQVSVRKPVEKLWFDLQKPISLLHQTLWLVINPREVSLGPITATDSTLVARLDLLAAPEILSGARPHVDSIPLPRLGRTKATLDTADVRMEGLLTWEAADSILSSKLVGHTIGTGWRKVKIEALGVRSAGRGRVLLDVTISGAARGTLHAIATPSYDPVTDEISMPDLAFDVNSAGYLTQAAVWLVNGPFLEEVRSKARIKSGVLMNELMRIVNKEVNRSLAEGVGLRGELSGAQVLNVHATRIGLVAQARGAGRLWIEISKQHLLPPRKAKAVAAHKD